MDPGGQRNGIGQIPSKPERGTEGLAFFDSLEIALVPVLDKLAAKAVWVVKVSVV